MTYIIFFIAALILAVSMLVAFASNHITPLPSQSYYTCKKTPTAS